MKIRFVVVSLVLVLCLAYGFQQKETSGIINVEGAKLHYLIQGNGTPCVVLGASILYIRTLSQKLRQNLKLIFLGLRHDAQSESSMEVNKITFDTYLSDIEQAQHVRLRKDLCSGAFRTRPDGPRIRTRVSSKHISCDFDRDAALWG